MRANTIDVFSMAVTMTLLQNDVNLSTPVETKSLGLNPHD
jgi:hypothetical protein